MAGRRNRTAGRFARVMLGISLLWTHAVLSPAHDESHSESAQKAAFVLRFAGYVEWPPEAEPTSAFHIAVLGDPVLAADLEALGNGRKIKKWPVRVSRAASVSQAKDAQVLVVGAAHRGELQTLLRPIAGNPVLVVTSQAGALSAGSVINFLPDQDRLRFEVSLAAARRAGLRIDSELLSVAVQVKQ